MVAWPQPEHFERSFQCHRPGAAKTGADHLQSHRKLPHCVAKKLSLCVEAHKAIARLPITA
jgi:hypothetical protein